MIRTDKAPLFCPEKGTEKRKELVAPPVEDESFKKWAGSLYRDYLNLYKQDEVLLDCWNTEQKKRGA